MCKLNKINARTEAHITVVTPIEFHRVLRDKLTIQEIHQIATKLNIQQSKFKVVCLGKGESVVDSRAEQTYYLVVDAPNLLKIRKEIFRLFKSRGGNVSKFAPDLFYPHITIGYTNNDLYLESNGVIKGKNSCFREVSFN